MSAHDWVKIFFFLIFALSLCVSTAFSSSIGAGIGVDIRTEDFAPLIWLCDSRLVADDSVQWGRVSPGNTLMSERHGNYAFEGESITWLALVMDKNGIEKVKDVYVTLGGSRGAGNSIEADCRRVDVGVNGDSGIVLDSCNARIGEEALRGAQNWDSRVMDYYACTLTVETPSGMYGEYWITAEAEDIDGLASATDEMEYWFFNPVIALSIEGGISFDNARPGTSSYSSSILVGNDADEGSGVLLDMFISGTNFYDSSSSGAMCPHSNVLSLSNFRYWAANGGYSTQADLRSDMEGYVGISYGDHWDRSMYNTAEIIQANPDTLGYWRANLLAPGADIALTFRLNLPEPCNGDFDSGSIYFWGEAV